MRWSLLAILGSSALWAGCSKKSAEGLPPAQEWTQNSAGAMVQTGPNAIPPPAPRQGWADRAARVQVAG